MYRLPRLDNKIPAVLLALAFALLIIIARLFFLQIKWGNHYIDRGEKNFLRTETLPSRRGNLYDCNGNILATNRPITCLVWQATGNRTLTVEQQKTLSYLSAHTKNNAIPLQTIAQCERHHKPCMLVRDLSHEELSTITEKYPNHPNLTITTQFERWYPQGTFASHIVGYLSRHIDTPNPGQMGLEKLCNEMLKGQDGMVVKTINSSGKDIAQFQKQESQTGKDIHTTLDLTLQKIAEEIYPADRSGCLLIMDPEDGAIKALVSRPAFDPALFLKPISHSYWSEIQHKKPFLNRALTPYPPGSIFKLVTISAALEKDFLQENQTWHCKGFVEFAGRKYWCSRRWGHGEISTTHAIAHSCNAMFFELGKVIDIDTLAEYAHLFGLGEQTGFLFSEGKGVIPSREWKLMTKGEQWWTGETLSVCIGQSFLLCTPLQIVRMISSIFTGYLVTPRILKHDEPEIKPLALKASTLDFLKQSMELVVQRGTGRRVSAVKDMKIFGKTSTAQIADFSKRKLKSEYMEHAWFTSYFQYKQFKPLVFLVLVEHAGSSQVTSSLARDFLMAMKKMYIEKG